MDTSQYLEIFLDETKEHLQNLNTQILELEQEPENMDTINEIFRAAHSLKGMAGTMGYKRMQNLTHDMENVFSEVRNGTIKVQPEMIDILFNCLDALEEYLANIQQTTEEGTNDNAELIKSLNDMLNKEEKEAKAEKEAPVAATAPAAESTSGNEKEKWREIKLNDTERMLVDKAHGEKLNVFGITVYVDESCVLKAARAFLVFKALEKLGEVIVSVPTAQDIEDEKFDLTFSLIFISGNTKDEVIAAIKSVSEIAEVYCEEYQMTAAPEEKAKEEAKKLDRKYLEIEDYEYYNFLRDTVNNKLKELEQKNIQLLLLTPDVTDIRASNTEEFFNTFKQFAKLGIDNLEQGRFVVLIIANTYSNATLHLEAFEYAQFLTSRGLHLKAHIVKEVWKWSTLESSTAKALWHCRALRNGFNVATFKNIFIFEKL